MKLFDLAEALDALPIAPNKIAARVTDRFWERRQAKAATDPTWAAIEARRHSDNSGGSTTFLSDDLTWADFEIQMEIAEKLTPTTVGVKLARSFKDVTLYRIMTSVVADRQRARKGWNEPDLWDMGRTAAYRIGQQLMRMADIAHGWPGTEEFPTFEDWQNALRHHGRVLTTKVNDGSAAYAHASNRWHAHGDSNTPEAKAAWAELRAVEEADHEAIKVSLYWFADHYAQLWD